jgi:hypothetical protein
MNEPVLTELGKSSINNLKMGDIPFKCEICQGLQSAREVGKFDDWSTSTPLTSLQSQSVRCSGPCVPIWTGVKQLVSTDAALNTSELRIGGGLGSSSVLRLLGSHDFQSTFDVEFFTEKVCNAGSLLLKVVQVLTRLRLIMAMVNVRPSTRCSPRATLG